MVTPDGSTIAAVKEKKKPANGAAGRGWSILPDDRTGAAAQRVLRYMVRDPKTKAAWVSALALGLIIPVVNALQGVGSVYLACFASGMLGVQMYNQFGQDTSAFWMVAQTISSTRDAYVELRARALALALVTVPFMVLVTVVTAALLGDWAGLPGGLGLALALLGSMLCTGALASAHLAYSIPTVKKVGMTLVTSVGGASGPLYGTFFLRAATAADDATSLDGPALVAALRAGLDGIVARGRAEAGDKTMYDALAPGLDALEASLGSGADLADAVRAAADAATVGRDATEPMPALKGRASYLGERSIGHIDPGAASTALLLGALADTLA